MSSLMTALHHYRKMLGLRAAMGIVIDGDRHHCGAEVVIVNIRAGCKEKRTNLVVPSSLKDVGAKGGSGHRYQQ